MSPLDMHLTHRSMVMITGATGGLGKAFAVECASRGWDLFLTDLSAQALETLAAGLRNGYEVNVLTHACDLTDPSARAELFECIRAGGLPRAENGDPLPASAGLFGVEGQGTPLQPLAVERPNPTGRDARASGPVDPDRWVGGPREAGIDRAEGFGGAPSGVGLQFWMLINVAGIDHEGPFYEQTSQQIRTILRLNIEATLEMTHALLAYRDPIMIFHIINVASLAAFYPMPAKATYAASKRFLLDFSLALRQEVRPLGATVTVLCPAGLPTTRECIEAIEAQGWMGHITTQDVGRVANETLNAALAGRAVVIPGWVNRLLQVLGGMLPTAWVIGLIGSRWKAAQHKRGLQRQAAAV